MEHLLKKEQVIDSKTCALELDFPTDLRVLSGMAVIIGS